jgi:hypothetical protein
MPREHLAVADDTDGGEHRDANGIAIAAVLSGVVSCATALCDGAIAMNDTALAKSIIVRVGWFTSSAPAVQRRGRPSSRAPNP